MDCTGWLGTGRGTTWRAISFIWVTSGGEVKRKGDKKEEKKEKVLVLANL